MKKLLFTLTTVILLLVSCSDDTSGDLINQNLSQNEDKRDVTIVFDKESSLSESIVSVEENKIVFKKDNNLT